MSYVRGQVCNKEKEDADGNRTLGSQKKAIMCDKLYKL